MKYSGGPAPNIRQLSTCFQKYTACCPKGNSSCVILSVAKNLFFYRNTQGKKQILRHFAPQNGIADYHLMETIISATRRTVASFLHGNEGPTVAARRAVPLRNAIKYVAEFMN